MWSGGASVSTRDFHLAAELGDYEPVETAEHFDMSIFTQLGRDEAETVAFIMDTTVDYVRSVCGSKCGHYFMLGEPIKPCVLCGAPYRNLLAEIPAAITGWTRELELELCSG